MRCKQSVLVSAVSYRGMHNVYVPPQLLILLVVTADCSLIDYTTFFYVCQLLLTTNCHLISPQTPLPVVR